MATKAEISKLLKINEKKAKIAEIQNEMQNPVFWQTPEKSRTITQELADLEREIDEFDRANTTEQLHQLEIKAILSDKYDQNNAILSLHAGAGGTEAQDWADMLLRMFLRYCEKRGYKTEMTD